MAAKSHLTHENQAFQMLSNAICGCLLLLIATSPALGQLADQRYQLGRRLIRFETAWQTANPDQRTASVKPVEQAVSSFFGLQLAEAAKRLDQARAIVEPFPIEQQPMWLEANQHFVDIETLIIDPSMSPVTFRVQKLYRLKTPPSDQSESNSDPAADSPETLKGTLQLNFFSRNSLSRDGLSQDRPLASTTLENPTLDAWTTWALPSLPNGDYTIRATLNLNGMESEIISENLTLCQGLDKKSEAITAWYESNRRGKGDSKQSSARMLAKEILQICKGAACETDIPWTQWIEDFESLSDDSVPFDQWIQSQPRTSRWCQLSNGNKSQVIRLQVPSALDKPTPVLFAFHGAGGSENMFFDTYGAGRLINLASERGWIVIAPRQTLNGLGLNTMEMLDELEKLLPIDRSRVMLVGHSMGAAQAMQQVSNYPQQIRAVAALGGGGMVKRSIALEQIPFYVAAGDRDFGRPRAMLLAKQLKEIKANVQYKDFENVEHLVIVQAALDDVFRFFDETLAPSKNGTSNLTNDQP
jgi:predicted esterase